jgi:hypothetical protein
MKRWIAVAVLLITVGLAGCAHRMVVVYASAPTPPAALNEAAQHGYQDGFEAARRDVADQRPPDIARHPRFRKPPVPPPAFENYRSGFKAGYDAFLRQGPPPRQ